MKSMYKDYLYEEIILEAEIRKKILAKEEVPKKSIQKLIDINKNLFYTEE